MKTMAITEPEVKDSKDEQSSVNAKETDIYTRRWYILLVFMLPSFNQALVFNTWGPITESSQAVFDWDNADIGMLANYANITFIICVLPGCWFMDVKGMRWATVASTFFQMIGACIRCITMEPIAATWTANVCAVFSALSGVVQFASPALLSSIWFPAYQRTTATALIAVSNYFGLSMSFIIGPQLVRSPDDAYYNVTNNMSNEGLVGDSYKNVTNIADLKTDIQHLLYLHGGLTVLAFVLVLVYFPSKPPNPPSVSASVQRTGYIKGLKQLLRNFPVWLMVLAYAVPVGALGGWSSVLDVNLKPLGVSQRTAGFLGFWMILAGCIAGLVISRFSDIFMRRMKLFLIAMSVGAIGSCAWFTLLCENYIDFNIPSLYVSCILIGIFVNGSVPLFFEITCETSYPVAEGVTGGFMVLVNNITAICFLFILLIKEIGTSWMNWVLLGSTAFAFPLLFLFPERYRRTDMDIDIHVH